MFLTYKRVSTWTAVVLLILSFVVGSLTWLGSAFAVEYKSGKGKALSVEKKTTSVAKKSDSQPKKASKSQLEKCWVLSQKTDQFGDVEVILGMSGCKIDCMRGTCRITSRKPSWDVQIYNLQDNRAKMISQKEWAAKGVQLVGGIKRHFDNKEFSQEKKTFQHLPVTRYFVETGHYRRSGAREMWQTNQSTGHREMLVLGVVLTSTEKIPCAPQCVQFLQSLYKTPRWGLPLEIRYIHPHGIEDPLMRTRSWKEAILPSSSFDYLSGGREAPSIESALFGRQMEDIMEEMVK